MRLTLGNLRQAIHEVLEEEQLDEFSGAGGGNIVGYSLPLGANPDDYGRKLNKPKKKKRKSK